MDTLQVRPRGMVLFFWLFYTVVAAFIATSGGFQ